LGPTGVTGTEKENVDLAGSLKHGAFACIQIDNTCKDGFAMRLREVTIALR
jgi:hypothetical protein